jgi:hypothetical protein
MKRPGYQPTTMDLPTELYEAIRKAAFDRRLSITEIVRQALAEWLERQGEK